MNQTRIKDYLDSRQGLKSVSPRERNDGSETERVESEEEDSGRLSNANLSVEDTEGHASHEVGQGEENPTQVMLFEMLKQQQTMMQTMSALLPGMSPDTERRKGIKRNIPAALGAPPKRDKVARASEHVMSEGEISDSYEENDTVSCKMGALLGDSDQEDSEGDIYQNIKDFFDKDEKLGPAVSGPTADLVEAVMRSTVSHIKEKELVDKEVRPSNCEALLVPKINAEIWKELKKDTKDTDMSFQKTQAFLNKGLVPLIKVMDRMRERKDRESLKLLGDALRLLALASSQISLKRKELIAPDLAPQFRQVCSASRPVTSHLFGEDLSKTLREIKETQNVGTKLTVQSQLFRGSPRGRGYRQHGSRFDSQHYKGQQNYKQRSFLGGRPAYHHNKKRGQGRQSSPPRKR